MCAVTLLSLFVILYFILPIPAQGQAPAKVPDVRFFSSVKGCAESASDAPTRAMGQSERGPSVMVSGNSVIYSQALSHLCCRKAELQNELGKGEIIIFETWSGQGCRCMCFSEIEAKLENLPSGHYTLTVYERGTEPGSSKQMEQTVIVTKEVGIR